MSFLSANEIRTRYLQFFAARGHAVLPSASLLPENDPTVLFTTAGMQPLVPYLLGRPHPAGRRLTSAQKCVRTGDIEEVGDNRHLTFFEMLGNWSLGDYFKQESIKWSFEFLTSKDHGLGLDPQRLYVTVFAGDADAPQDTEAIGLWQEAFRSVGIEALVDTPVVKGGRITTLGKADNWWGPAGQTGPCGPDTEIFYDVQNDAALTSEDGLPTTETGRLVEIWNNVFMQYEKTVDGSFVPLDQHNVDTGMGLERIAMILQEKDMPFATDLFTPLMEVVARLPLRIDSDQSRFIIADHIRAAVRMIADGVVPTNKDRGYVLRRLIRRAALQLAPEAGTAWITTAVAAVVSIYDDAYPELAALAPNIVQSLQEEMAKFQRSVEKGLAEIHKLTQITGKDAFNLYQSFGFPWELTKEYAAAQGLSVEAAEFEAEFKKHQDLSRTASAGQFASGLADRSTAVVAYHTATHLMHQALRNILGPHVQQKGSNITPERLRFDFSHPDKLTPEQIAAVELEVNTQIQASLPVTVATMTPDAAHAEGALGFFGHKYGDSVTMYSIGTYSKEICTGPHVQNTRELGVFKIQKEEAVSAGVRRIKAVLE